ncbi:MAG: hypothetical protein KJ018_18210, partial [Burkholderiales bacterium]|nr:hypothetical protein [Burkholderiales bacterium]
MLSIPMLVTHQAPRLTAVKVTGLSRCRSLDSCADAVDKAWAAECARAGATIYCLESADVGFVVRRRQV